MFLVEMADGGILDFEYESSIQSGCPTCGYGEGNISEVEIKMSKITVQFSTFDMEESKLIKLFARNLEKIKSMQEIMFSNWLKNYLDDNFLLGGFSIYGGDE